MLEEIKANPNVNLISLDSVEVGYYYNKESSLSDGKTASLPYSSLLLQVQVGQTYKASGRVAKWPAVFVFYDSEGNNKGYAYSGDSNGDIQYTDVFVTVPDGATQMIYQYKQDYPHYLGICDYNYGGKVNKLQENVIAIEESLQAFDDKYSPVLEEIKENPNVNLISLDSAEVGYYYNKGVSLSDGKTASSSYSSLLLQAQEGQLYKASGRVGATPAVFVFYDSDGNNKGYAYSGDSSGDIQYTDVLVTVPDGATQMVYQYKQDYPHYLGLCDYDYYSPIQGLQEEVQEIQSNVQELEKIKKLTKLANVYDYEEIGVVEGVINTSGNITPGGFSTGLIPIKADHFYYLSNRYAGAVKSIRCIADNGTTRSKVRVASTGLEPDSGIYYYLPSVDGATSVSNGQFKTSPTAAYLQISLTALSATELEDYYKIMLEDVGGQYNPDFIPSDYTSNNIVINDALLEYPVKPVIKRVELLENNGGVLKVLLIGSSHGMNTIGQFPILAYHSGVNIICANAYQGSLSLQQVAEYCTTGNVFSGWYKKFQNGVWGASQSVTINQMLQDEKWDFISVQRSASEDMTWNEEQAGYLETILAYITANTNYTPTIVFNSGFADSYSIARRAEQQADTEVIWTTAQQVKAAYGIDIIPMAPALQLVRNNDTLASLGTYRYNMLSCDSQHLDQGIGMYVSGCICFNFFLKHLGRSILSCRYLPTVEDMTPFWYDIEKFTAIEEQYAKEIRKIVNQY